MLPAQLDVAGFQVGYDPRQHCWHLSSGLGSYRMREWSWSERHRLVAACVHEGHLDQGAFLAGLAQMLYEPAPDPELSPLFAYMALRLMGVQADPGARSLGDGERLLAQRFGWRPGDLEDQPAAALDALLMPLRDGAATPPGEGWTRLLFADPAAESDSPA